MLAGATATEPREVTQFSIPSPLRVVVMALVEQVPGSLLAVPAVPAVAGAGITRLSWHMELPEYGDRVTLGAVS